MCWMFSVLAIVILSNYKVYSSFLDYHSILLKVEWAVNTSLALRVSLEVLNSNPDH